MNRDSTVISDPLRQCHYLVICSLCNKEFLDDGYILQCPVCLNDSLLRSSYRNPVFSAAPNQDGLYRYRNWLPISRTIQGAGKSITLQSDSLSKLTGLKNLWLAFSGYWPEKNGSLPTGSFKELEAYCVLSRFPHKSSRILTVASAGNTAAAFAHICSHSNIPCLVFVPDFALPKLRFSTPINSCVRVIAVTDGGDYMDAIRAANAITESPLFAPEGGVRNIARRDGLATVLLNAFEIVGRLPDYYFQAIGSGTGAIAVNEAARRITRGESPLPRLFLSQNSPFTPIYDTWKAREKRWTPLQEPEAKLQIAQMVAPVLANRMPPYSVRGGLYEALIESKGDVLAITNEEAMAAAQIFEQCEGIDLEPAAAVSLASLLKALASKSIPTDATVLLNLTGGGNRRYASDFELLPCKPNLKLSSKMIGTPEMTPLILRLFGI